MVIVDHSSQPTNIPPSISTPATGIISKCCYGEDEPQQHVRGVGTAKFGATARFWDAHVRDVARMVAVFAFFDPSSCNVPCHYSVIVFYNMINAHRRKKRSKTAPGQSRQPGPDDGEPQHSNPDNAVTCTNDASGKRDKNVVGAQKRPGFEYSFINWDFSSSSVPPEDIAFLSSKGCRIFPDEDATDEFVRQYFKRIHPSVPVVDEAEFWRIYQDGSGPGKKLSLFVFQAILFASCPVSHAPWTHELRSFTSSSFLPINKLVSLETLRRCGFGDKQDARKQLHNRAKVSAAQLILFFLCQAILTFHFSKLLFDLKAETRPSAKAQGAILLTHHTSAEDPQAGSLWLMKAIESMKTIDAQPSMFVVEHIPESLKKRLWWSILLRDRSLCIGLRRRPQVPVEYCDWLTEEDFEDEIQHSRVHDEATKRRLFQALQEQCQLAVLLSELVSLIFVPRAVTSCFLCVEDFDGLMSTIKRIKLSLVEWQAQDPLSPPTPTTATDLDDPVDILTNLTFMYLQYVDFSLSST